jgi:hypothetical protein
VTYDNTYIIKTNAPTAIQFNYLGINRVNFLVTNSMFIMDNVIANIQCATHCSNYVISWHLAVNPDCPFPSNVVAVAAGYQHSLFLKGDSTVAACGSYKFGFSFQPLNIPDGLTNIIAVSGGDSHSLMLKSNGTVLAFGYDTDGQTIIPPGLSNVIAISAGTRHSLALKEDGKVVGWGGGIGAVVPQGISNVVAISAGRDTSLALKADGTVTGWGAGNLSILPGLTNIVAIGAGDVNYYEAWMALQADGRIIEGPVSGAMRYLDVSNVVAISVSRGDDGSIDLALRSDGSMVAWGYNFDGTLGGGPLIPPELPPGFVVSIAAGDYINLAVMSNAPPPAGPPLLSFGKGVESFWVSVPTRSGRVYRLEYAATLNAPNWAGLPLVAGNGGTRMLTDPNANGSQRFYRVRHW